MIQFFRSGLVVGAVLISLSSAWAQEPIPILKLDGFVTDPKLIDYEKLPRLPGTLAVVSPAFVHPEKVEDRIPYGNVGFQLHSYLIHHEGRFWCIWSSGPPVEDEPTQEVRYATSEDGITWTKSHSVTGTPDAPYAFIARGLWVWKGELLALAAHFKGKGAFGVDKALTLRAYAWDKTDQQWKLKETLYDDAINNFPPQRLRSGDWIMTRRDARFNVSVLIGGRDSLNDWKSYPVVGRREVPKFSPDEPIFWPLKDGTLFALFRDNGGSQRLFHATSSDGGKNWSTPALTNVPNSSSKIFSALTSRGYRVLISNGNPKLNRRELHLSVSRDGRTFTKIARLSIPAPPKVDDVSEIVRTRFREGVASLQYPHVIEHDDHLLIAFSRNKKQIELLRVSLDDVDRLLEK